MSEVNFIKFLKSKCRRKWQKRPDNICRICDTNLRSNYGITVFPIKAVASTCLAVLSAKNFVVLSGLKVLPLLEF